MERDCVVRGRSIATNCTAGTGGRKFGAVEYCGAQKRQLCGFPASSRRLAFCGPAPAETRILLILCEIQTLHPKRRSIPFSNKRDNHGNKKTFERRSLAGDSTSR